MDEAAILEALRGYWLNGYSGREQVLWEDDEQKGPEDKPWLRVTIRSSGSVRPVVGRSREENRGLIMVQIFSPRADGPGRAERVATDVANLWRAFRHERIRLDAPSVTGLMPEGAFNRHQVTLGWRGDMRF